MDFDEKPVGPDAPKAGPFRRRSAESQSPPDLPQAVREEGFIRPVRRTYRHVLCDKVTSMGQEAAEAFARDPKCFEKTYCHQCQDDFPVAHFVWESTDEPVGS